MDWHEIAKYLWGLLVPAGWWMWNTQDKRMAALEATMKEKADKAELDRQRDNISNIFEKIDGLKDSMNDKFDSITRLILEQRK